MSFVRQHPCLTFVLLVVGTPYALLLPLLAVGVEPRLLQPLKLPLAFTPLLYAILVVSLLEGAEGASELFGKFWSEKARLIWYVAGILVFVLAAFLTLGIRYCVDGFFPARSEFASWQMIVLMTLPLLFFPGVTEEFAWRGFLQSRLEVNCHWWVASLCVGFVWGTWHGFDFLLGNWTFSWATIGGYPVYILSCSIIIGWVFHRSGQSVFVAMLAHFGCNAVNFYTPVFEEYLGSALPAIVYIGSLGAIALLLPVVDHFLSARVVDDQPQAPSPG